MSDGMCQVSRVEMGLNRVSAFPGSINILKLLFERNI